MRILHLLLIVSLLSVFFKSWGQNARLPRLQAAVKSLDQDPAMKSANWGITVINPRTGEILLDHHGNKSLATASTMKVVSTASAMAALGPDYRFVTTLEYSGTISSSGTLQGNLYIRGSGDPTLGSERFGTSYELPAIMNAWIAALRAKGIRSITGDVIGDATCYGTQLTPPKWPWEDMGNYYGAGAGGLNVYENLYRLDLKPGAKQGDPTSVVGTDPPQASIRFLNEITTGRPGSGDNGYIYGSPYTYERYLRGTIPPGRPVFSIKGSIPDPALYTAQSVYNALKKAGISVRGRANTIRLGASVGRNRKTIATHQSPPLKEIANETNQKSVNLFAEALALAAGTKMGSKASTASALDAIESYWKGKGVSTQGMYLRDGSGLSPNNVLSTKQLATLLSKVYQSSYFDSFDQTLPVAGRSGSLKRMMRGTAAEGRLRAKSGYISGVRSYAGYVQTASGELLAFAMIANYYSGSSTQMRQKFSTLMIRLAEGK